LRSIQQGCDAWPKKPFRHYTPGVGLWHPGNFEHSAKSFPVSYEPVLMLRECAARSTARYFWTSDLVDAHAGSRLIPG
jgi:hypothetical protein